MGARPLLIALAAVCVALLPSSGHAAQRISVSPSSLSFGSQCPGQTSAPQVVTVSNSGDAPLNVSSAGIVGSNPGDFTMGGAQTPRTLAPGESFAFTVAFRSLGPGERTASLAISSNDPSAGTKSVPMSGRGVDRTIAVEPKSLNFGSVRPGRSSKQTLGIVNQGSEPVALAPASISGAAKKDFKASNPSSTTLQPGERTTISVTFAPAVPGTRSASLAVDSNACSGSIAVALSGIGAAAAIKSDPTTLNMGEVAVGSSSSPVPLVVSNDGRAPLRVKSIAIEGSAAQDFTMEGLPPLPKTVGAGESFLMNAVFRPTSPGPRSATIRIQSDDPAHPVLFVGIAGNDVGTASASASPSADASPATTPTSHNTVAVRTGGGGAGDYVVALVVVAVVGGIFAGLFRMRRSREDIL